MYSAHLAAAKGLPYVFAHHFSGKGTEEALEVYRTRFKPSTFAAEPVTFLTVNAAVADTHDEAVALMLPNLQMMARLRTGQPLGPVPLVEEAAVAQLSPAQQHRGLRLGAGRRRRTRGGRRTAARARRTVRCRRGDGAPGGLSAPRHRSRDQPRPGSDTGAARQGAVLVDRSRLLRRLGVCVVIHFSIGPAGSGGLCTNPG